MSELEDIELDVVEKGYHEVYVDGVKVSQHSKQLKAVARGLEEKSKNQDAEVAIKRPDMMPVSIIKIKQNFNPPVLIEPEKVKAFPSAKGAAANITGGRGGEVIHVTTLDWYAEGGLRQAITTKGARIIVFDVSGEIDATSEGEWSTIINNIDYSNLTIAGQSAPNGGITIRTSEFGFDKIDNVIIRFVRFRLNQFSTRDAALFSNNDGLILDHCTFSHGGDEAIDLSNVGGNVTVSRSFFQDSKTGFIIGSETTPINSTIVDNLFINISHRFPNPHKEGRFDVINNVVYNWTNRLIRVTHSPQLNEVNNYYKTSVNGLRRSDYFPNNSVIPWLNKVQLQQEDTPLIYTAGNIITGQRDEPQADDRENWAYFDSSDPIYPVGGQVADQYFTSEMFELVGEAFDIKTAKQAYEDVLNDVGANKTLNADGTVNFYQDSKDENDILMIKNDTFVSEDVNAMTYKPRTEVPYPTIPENVRPSNFYGSNPHIPEVWFSANVPSGESHNDLSPSGYTWLEQYLNQVDYV